LVAPVAPKSPDLNPVDYPIWGAVRQFVYRRRCIRDVEHVKEVMQTCWEQIGQDVIDRAMGQFRKRLSLVVATAVEDTIAPLTSVEDTLSTSIRYYHHHPPPHSAIT